MRQIADDLYDRGVEEWYDTVQCRVLFLPAEKEGDFDKKLACIKNVDSIMISVYYSKSR
ncbi:MULTISPECIES: hypothetical protein [unclassified Bacillus (in: firmicutes)]|uniref:hypothetical protein n=1 Tax=unclassified Bacillus (in: firmicutes) TaxID=185979 RepID=UPI003D220B1F